MSDLTWTCTKCGAQNTGMECFSNACIEEALEEEALETVPSECSRCGLVKAGVHTCLAKEKWMKRYEYMTRTHSLGKLPDGSIAPPFETWLNSLGEDGWHLAAMDRTRKEIMSPNHTFCVFARLLVPKRTQQ